MANERVASAVVQQTALFDLEFSLCFETGRGKADEDEEENKECRHCLI